MAIVRPGPLIGGISGKVGTIVFVNSRTSVVVRPAGFRIHDSSPFTAIAKGRLSNIRRAWSQLTSNQQAAWRTAATTFPTTNRLGLTSATSGFLLFVKTNVEMRNDPPTLKFVPFVDGITSQPDEATLAFSASGDYDVSSFDGLPAPGGFWQVFGWPFWRNTTSRYPARFVHLKLLIRQNLITEVRDEWTQHFGAMQEGQRFSIGLTRQFVDGYRSHIAEFRGTVVA